MRVWVCSGPSDSLGQLLGDDAQKRQEATQFSSEHIPGDPAKFTPPKVGPTGTARKQDASMVPRGVSHAIFDKIGYLETIATDTTMPDEFRASEE